MPKDNFTPDFAFEREQIAADRWPCAGVDEAGRGPLAGPVVAAAVVLDPGNIPDGLDDSKKLSSTKRADLFDTIISSALAVAVSSVSAEAIDNSDIRKAALSAMTSAVCGLAVMPKFALIDGRDIPKGLPCGAQALIKGDGRSQSIAAASIIAKVLRDRMMARAGMLYPAYGLRNHAGYGTAAHRKAIEDHGGVKRLHRFSFSPLRQRKLEI
ncbi:MAG: ribonuclease HII [Gammaproteobacteria bacterium]|nr:ribonuclease HII [Gammaproteobacteria bacterium]